jgi:hypothetical protein
MEQFIILNFPSKAQAEYCLWRINQMAATYWVEQGYTVINGELIGRNALTGEDMPDSARTISWDTVKQSPDKTFYFSSLSNDPRFAKGMEQLPADLLGFTEMEFPAAWVPVDG